MLQFMGSQRVRPDLATEQQRNRQEGPRPAVLLRPDFALLQLYPPHGGSLQQGLYPLRALLSSTRTPEFLSAAPPSICTGLLPAAQFSECFPRLGVRTELGRHVSCNAG